MGMLDGKKGIVTGGGSGLGRANSLGLAAQGAEIAVADLNFETAQKTVSDIEAAGGRGIAIQADVSQGSDVQSLVDKAVQAMGRLDLLVNCAGILPKTPLVDMSEEEWRRVMDINMTSMFFTCRAAARQMIAQGGGGKMVNFASGRGVSGMENASHYSASKGGIIAFTAAIGMELGHHGINVNAVCPGAADTPMMRSATDEASVQFLANAPYNRRLIKPEDVVGSVLFLLTDLSREYYGQTLFIKAT